MGSVLRSSRRKGRKNSKRRSRKTYRATPSAASNERSLYTIRIQNNTLTISPPNHEVLEKLNNYEYNGQKTTQNVVQALEDNIPGITRVQRFPERSEVIFSILVSVPQMGNLPYATRARKLFE